MEVIKGNAHLFGKNIDTDQIYPGQYLELVDKEEIASHCLQGARKSFASEVKHNDVVVAGTNFGCGSSREHAAIALKQAGVGVVIAESFARIFYRNAINMGLPVLICKGVLDKIYQSDLLEIDFSKGQVKNLSQDKVYECEKLPEYVREILLAGGIKAKFIKDKEGVI